MTTDVSIRLRLIDDATKGFKRLEQQTHIIQQHMREESRKAAEEAARASEQSNERIRRGFSQLEQQTRAIQERMAANARRAAEESVRAARTEQDAHIRAYQHINEARERLNVRSHAQIRDDISRTRAAYQTLAQSGVSSFREQVQAAERMRTTIRGLTNEMGHLTNAQRTHGALRFGAELAGGIGGGAAGFAYGVKEPIKDSLDYDRRLDYLSVTAFPERDARGKKLGAMELKEAVHAAVDASGGKIDGVTSLLGEMIAAGQMPLAEIYKNLPYLAKTAVANDANPQDVGRLANILYSQGFVKNPKELEQANNIIVTVGQMSGFEYKNQVMHLPSQLPYARTAGMSGLKAVRDVAVMNATSNLVMGTPDEAGVATHNALMKMSSQDTAKDFEKAGRGNLYDALMKARSKGIDALEFWQKIVEQEIAANPKLKAYKAKLDQAKSPQEAKEALAAIEMIGRGSAISKYFQEMRGQTGILGYQNAPYRQKLQDKADLVIKGQFTPNENNFDYISKTSVHKIDVLENTYDKQQKHLIEKATPSIANAAEMANTWAGQHPGLSSLIPSAPWIASGVAGAVGGKMLMSRLFPAAVGGAAEGAASSSIAAGATALLSRASLVAASATTQASLLLARLPAIGQAAATYAAPYMPLVARGTAVGGAGYAGYQVGGGVDYAIGKIAQALTGNETKLSTALGSALYDFMNYTPEPVEIKPIQVDTTSSLTISLAPGLVVTSQKSATTSNAPSGQNTSKVSTGNIFKGAP